MSCLKMHRTISHYLNFHIKYDPLLKKTTLNQLKYYMYGNVTSYSSLSQPAWKQYFQKEKFQAFQHSLDRINYVDISTDDAEKLLNKCGDNIIGATKISKNELCQKIFKNLIDHDKVNFNIVHAYINVCTENNVKLNIQEVLQNIKCKITKETYKLLLKNVCERGDIDQALQILDMMKLESVPLDEFIFNNLVLAHSASGGLAAAENILNTMRAAQLNISNDTKLSILKGILRYSNVRDFDRAVEMYGFKLNEYQLLDIVNELNFNNIIFLSKIENLYDQSTFSKEFRNDLKQKCISFVHMNESDVALLVFKDFYKLFVDEDGFFILEEMVYSNYDTETIKSSLNALQEIGVTEYLLERLIGIALKSGKTNVAWSLLEMLPSELRPHFFWPLLISGHKNAGEVGIFQTMLRMKKMNVKFDFETWTTYVLPYCNLVDYKLLIKKFQSIGFTAKELVSPFLTVLLRNENVKIALDLCSHYNVKIFGEELLNVFPIAWYSTKDSISIALLLQKYCESNDNLRDFVGLFLINSLKLCKNSEDFQNFCNLLKVINEKSLKILSPSTDTLKAILKIKPNLSENLRNTIEDEINSIFDFGMKSGSSYIPQPKDMTVEELECHLLELQENNMNTRGILRKLILLHSNLGNTDRVKKLRDQCLEEGHEESIGMKSSIFHGFVKAEEIIPSLELYREIKKINPNFILDNFKIIDFCTLLVKNGQISEAFTILKEETKMKKQSRTEGIRRNCLELLNAFKNEEQQMEMFNLLVSSGFCKPENIILGPLIKIYISKGNLEKASDTYIQFAQKYKCTPLQVELMKEILMSQNEELLQRVLESTSKVHGNASATIGLIAAAAECGNTSILVKIFSKNVINVNYLKQRCDKWTTEGKPEALLTLLSACFRVNQKFIDTDYIIKALIKIYEHDCDLQALSRLYDYLMDNEIETNIVKKIPELIENIQQKNG